MAAWIKRPLAMEVGLGPGDVVLDGDPAPPSPKRGRSRHPPKLSAHVYCGQTAGWIKMVLGVEVGLSPGDVVLDGDPAPPSPKRGRSPHPPNYRPMFIVPNGWMDQDGTWHGGRPQPRGLCFIWGLSAPLPQIFGPCLLSLL